MEKLPQQDIERRDQGNGVPVAQPKASPDVLQKRQVIENATAFLGLDTPQPYRKAGAIHLGMSVGGGEHVQPFTIDQDPQVHGFICGSTGRGKTYLATAMAEELAQNHGLIFLDPKGDAVKRLLGRLLVDPKCRDRVIYWDINSQTNLIGYNPLMRRPELNISVQVDIVVEAVLRAFQAKNLADTPLLGRRLPTLFEIILRTGHTLLEAMEMVVFWDSDIRRKILRLAEETGMPDFMIRDWDRLASIHSERVLQQELQSVFSRIFHFVRNPQARLILGQTENTLDLWDIMQNKKILLVNLNPRAGKHLAHLIAMLLLNEIAQLSILREGSERNQHVYVFADEYSRISTESLTEFLPLTRAYGVWFYLMTQYLRQLGKDKEERQDALEAILTNTDFRAILGGCSPQDCEILADSILGSQLNLKIPQILRTAFRPIQKYIELISETLGRSTTITDINSQSKGTSRNRTKGGTWYNGYASGLSESVSEADDLDPDKRRHNRGANESQSSNRGGSESEGEGETSQHTTGQNIGKTENESRTVSHQWVTFYEEFKEVVSYWGLETMKHIAWAFLSSLPKATAMIQYRPESTKLVFIKWIKPKKLHKGVVRRRLKKMYANPIYRTEEEALRRIQERQATSFGSPDQDDQADDLDGVFS